MGNLDGVTSSELRTALDEIEGSRPSMRLIAALAYEHGVTQTELARWFDVERKTVYNWLSRFEERPGSLATAARDAPRPGRPARLTEEQRAELAEALERPPGEAGYDAPSWRPSLVREHVRSRHGVDYTPGSCRRLLAELGGD